MKKKAILFFDEIDKNDIARVGGKGANLGELTKGGFQVPAGFCVTTAAYQDFLRHNNLAAYITACLADVSLDHSDQIGEKIRVQIKKSEIPQALTQEIARSLLHTGVDRCYAVRSSATAEDLEFASFAGQQDTYLNITGVDAILNAMRDCWASLFTDRAILYRIQNNIDHEKVYMAVIIQHMVWPEISGIMFTANPVSGHRGMISIDAGYGLGEALAAGLVSPDIYQFGKHSRLIENKVIGQKKLAILPVTGGGTVTEAITGAQSTRQVMTDAQIITLAQLGIAIENYYGAPQDIEWCLEKDAVSIVQSRPITSLFPLPKPRPRDQALHAYVSFNHFQVMTDPISPLGIDMLRMIFPLDTEVRNETDYRYLTSAAGRIYIDLSEVLQFKALRKILPSFFSNVDVLLAKALTELVNRPDFNARIRRNKQTRAALLKYMGPIVFNTLKNLVYKNPVGTVSFMEAYIDKRLADTRAAIGSASPGVDRLEAIIKTSSFQNDFQQLIPKMAPAILSYRLLERLETKLLGTNQYVNVIVKGLEGNITTEMGLLVGDLADQVRVSPDLVRAFENPDYQTLIARISQLQGHTEFKKAFSQFMLKYGIRAAGEIDIASSRWIENPEPLAKSILAIVNTAAAVIHRQEYQETTQKANAAARALLREVTTRHGKVPAAIVRRLVRVLRNTLPIREHPKYLIMGLFYIFKEALLAEARVMVQQGRLTDEADLFYVGFWELYAAVQANNSLIALVDQRKAEYCHYQRISPPRVMTSDGEAITAGYQPQNMPAGALPGIPVSSGVIEGIARVITDPTRESINKGEILVAPFTDPGWTPLFINAAGLVMEIGGLLTHGTVVAREYGIPAVVGVLDATKKIKTGQRISVDGNTGFVMVMDD